MENPNATWNDFSTRIIQRDVSFQVSSNFLNDEKSTLLTKVYRIYATHIVRVRVSHLYSINT